MRAQLIVTVLAVSLAAPAWAGDRAVPRGGGSHSSSGIGRHPSPSGGGHSGSSSAAPRSGAQARHPRPGTGHAYRGGHYGGYYGHRYPYYPYYGYGYPYYYGYYGYPYAWGFGFGWYDGYYTPPYYHYRDYDDALGHLRILVEPSKARVYVDDYYAGEVDEFDGMFQRLNVARGRHEVTLKLEGYVTHRVKVYVPADATVKIRHDMVKGSGPETVEDRISEEDQRAMREEEEPRYDAERDRRERERARRPARESDSEREDEAEDVPPPATLRLRVAPVDASIYIDGRFRGTGRQLDELLLPPGRHKLEVVRPGYRTHESEFEVDADKPTDLELSLDKLG